MVVVIGGMLYRYGIYFQDTSDLRLKERGQFMEGKLNILRLITNNFQKQLDYKFRKLQKMIAFGQVIETIQRKHCCVVVYKS